MNSARIPIILPAVDKKVNKIKRIIYTIGCCKNWGELILPMLKGNRPERVILRNGVLMEAPEGEALIEMIDEIFRIGVYTPANLPIEPDDIVVDIGANVGVFAVYAASRTKNTVLAFEPSPANVEFLRKNTQINSFHNIVVHNLAVSDRSGTENFALARIGGGHLLSSHSAKGEIRECVEISTTTLERIIRDNSLEQIDFLKLDCEGAEGQILQSTPRSQIRKIRKIAIEFHDNVSSLHHGKIAELLEAQGFSCWLHWDGRSPFGYLYGRKDL